MKRFYKLAATVDNRPQRLLAAILLAFLVMLMINGFVGCMGGFPAFLAFLLAFYLLRTLACDGRRITHRLAMTTTRRVGWLFGEYLLGYLLVWAVLRVGFVVFRTIGWGSVGEQTLAAYVSQLFSVSFLEKWAYLYAALLMLAFVVSLFPLVVLKDAARFLRYAFLDFAAFGALCMLLGQFFCLLFETGETRASCLIDHLLLSGKLSPLEELICFLVTAAATVLIGVLVFFYAVRVTAPKKGQLREQPTARRGMSKWSAAAAVIAVTAAAAALVILFLPGESQDGYTRVAQFLTNDTVLAPIEYAGTVYIPVDGETEPTEGWTAQGYLAEKDEDCTSRFYRLAVANLLYTDTTGEDDCVRMSGADTGVYAPAARLTAERAWEDDMVFLLWDEDWAQESAYSREATGYAACSKDLIEGLLMQAVSVTYDAEDFSDYDAYFTIRAYESMEQALEGEPLSGDWAGCILVKDDKFYFGSYENGITGICLEQLKEVLGGNR